MKSIAIIGGIIFLMSISFLGCEYFNGNSEPTINAIYLNTVSIPTGAYDCCDTEALEMWYAADELTDDVDIPVEYYEKVSCEDIEELEFQCGMNTVAESIEINDSEIVVEIDDQIIFTVDALDPDGDELTYEYTIEREDGEIIKLEGYGNAVTWNPDALGGFVFNCGVKDEKDNKVEKRVPGNVVEKGAKPGKEDDPCKKYNLWVRTVVDEKDPNDKNKYRITAIGRLVRKDGKKIKGATVVATNETTKRAGRNSVKTDNRGKFWVGSPKAAQEKSGDNNINCINLAVWYISNRKPKGDIVRFDVTIPAEEEGGKAIKCSWKFKASLGGNWKKAN